MAKKYDICVFGGCSLDMTYFQKEDGSFNNEADLVVPGGKGSNQAVASSRAGAKVVMISKVGEDYIGEIILNNLKTNKVNINSIDVSEDLKNDCCKIYIDYKTKDNEIVRENGSINSFTIDMVEQHKQTLLNSKVIVAQMKIPKEVSIALINFCYKNNLPIVITPCRPEKLILNNQENKELLNKITYITANKKECEIMFETTDIESCVKQYPNKLIVTLGNQGLIYHNGKQIVKLNAIDVSPVVDTTGAGDTFCGNFSAFISSGMEFSDAIEKAQYASALKITEKTAQKGMPYLKDLNKFIKEYNKNHH